MIEHDRDLLRDAIAAVRDGRRGTAYDLLHQIVAADPDNSEAWLWLSGVEVEPAAQRAALERVVALEPGNTRALRGLAWLEEHYPGLQPLMPSSTPGPGRSSTKLPAADHNGTAAPSDEQGQTALEPAIDADLAPTVSLEALRAMEREASPAVVELAQPIEPIDTAVAEPDPELHVPVAAVSDGELLDADAVAYEPVATADDTLRCPFCGAEPSILDTVCPQCNESLIVPAGRKPGARIARLLLALIWLISGCASIAGIVWVLGDPDRIKAVTDGVTAWSQVFGVSSPIDPSSVVRAIGLVLGGLAAVAVIMVAGLVLRWRPVYGLQVLLSLAALVGAGALLVLSLPMLTTSEPPAVMAGTNGTLVTIGLLAFVLIPFLLTLMCRREFFPRWGRVHIPPQPPTPAEQYRLGVRYVEWGWYWLAKRELQAAAEAEPGVLKYRRALADVYANMGDEQRAREELRASLNLPSDLSPQSRAGRLAEEVQRGRQ